IWLLSRNLAHVSTASPGILRSTPLISVTCSDAYPNARPPQPRETARAALRYAQAYANYRKSLKSLFF
ncbi:MAG: hypothetical protein J7J06_00355, partial [Methanosarcinales archaeon]|nr:hypothetical protein [Methanosarcinales archaeon]